jgi:hypothetical protein
LLLLLLPGEEYEERPPELPVLPVELLDPADCERLLETRVREEFVVVVVLRLFVAALPSCLVTTPLFEFETDGDDDRRPAPDDTADSLLEPERPVVTSPPLFRELLPFSLRKEVALLLLPLLLYVDLPEA